MRALEALGNAEIARSANVANRLVDRPTRAMATLSEGSPVAKTLLDLRATVEKLDPSRQGDLFSARKLLGVMPFGNKLRDYFRGYESSQSHLNAIIESLRRGKDELLRDNAAIETEKANMWGLMGELEKHGYLARALGDAVDREVQALQTSDPERARALQEEVLFTARQKQQDIATQLAVNVQGYMALDLIKRNNAELVKGVDRATTTTVAALHTAIARASRRQPEARARPDRRRALHDVRTDPVDLADAAPERGAHPGRRVGPTIDVDKLKEAFANVRATIDGMADYRIKALSSMERTVDALNDEVGNAKRTSRRAATCCPSSVLSSARCRCARGRRSARSGR